MIISQFQRGEYESQEEFERRVRSRMRLQGGFIGFFFGLIAVGVIMALLGIELGFLVVLPFIWIGVSVYDGMFQRNYKSGKYSVREHTAVRPRTDDTKCLKSGVFVSNISSDSEPKKDDKSGIINV